MSYNEQYRDNPQPAFVGMIADQSAADTFSRTASTALPFGSVVVRDGEHKVRVVAEGDVAADIFGFTARGQAANNDGVTTNQYPENDTATVLRRGAIWVNVANDVTAGQAVHVNVTNGEISSAGGVTIARATFESSATAGNLARVHVL